MLVKAYAALAADKPLAPHHIDRKEPGAYDVAIEIHYCGICHSDIHTVRNEWGGAIYPVVPGHEIVGIVTSVGDKVKKFKPGDYAGVGCMVDSCRSCASCTLHLEQYCEEDFIGTYNSKKTDWPAPTYGGYSSSIVVDEAYVLHLPDTKNLAAVAPLLCAGITTYSPLAHVGLKKGDRLAVVGLGGLGHMAVKIGASFGAEVTVISQSERKKEDAKRLGAAHFINATDKAQMATVTNSFDYILDTVANKHDITSLSHSLKRDGTLILVGAPEHPHDLEAFSLILKRRRILGSLIGGIKETQEMLNHCAKHQIVSDIELIKASQINEAYERMLKSDVRYRFVIDCKTF